MSEGRVVPINGRGGENGMPATRGSGSDAQRPAQKLDSKSKKAIEEFQRKQAQAQKALQNQLQKKVTLQELVRFGNDFNKSLMNMSTRVECIVHTLKRLGRDEHAGIFEKFEELFSDSYDRIMKWRVTVKHLEGDNISLREFRDAIRSWNSDLDNPQINGSCFHQQFLDKKFGQNTADLSLLAEERLEFAVELGLNFEEILGEATEGVSEALDMVGEGQDPDSTPPAAGE